MIITKVYDIKTWNQLHFQQIVQIYSRRYLKFHNLLDLSCLHYDCVPSDLESKRIQLNKSLIKLNRIKWLFYTRDERFRKRYWENDRVGDEDYYTITSSCNDEDIGFVFIEMFSHTKKIIPLLLRCLPIFDLSTINSFKGTDELRMVDPVFNPWIVPKLKIYKRYNAFNDENHFFRMGFSYSLPTTNMVVVYIGNIDNSRMIEASEVEYLFFKNNGRFFKSYYDYFRNKGSLKKSTKVYFIYDAAHSDEVNDDAKEECKEDTSITMISEYRKSLCRNPPSWNVRNFGH